MHSLKAKVSKVIERFCDEVTSGTKSDMSCVGC